MTRYLLYACVLLAGTLAAVQVTATEPAELLQLAQNNDTSEARGSDPDAAAPDAIAAAEAAESWEALAWAALNEPDDALRGEAIQDVGLQRHADAVAVLVQVAVSDVDPDNRLQAVTSLWYSAADGLDGDGTIRAALQAALDDPDEQVAAMAKRALEDLEALEISQ